MRFFRIFLVIALCVFLSYVLLSLFNIHTIEVTGTDITLSLDYEHLPKSLLFFPSDKIASEIKSENPFIDSVTFNKKFPYTLGITVVKRTPVARLRTVGQIVELSENGVVLGDSAESSQLPELLFPMQHVRAGNTIDDRQIRFSLLLLTHLPDGIVFRQIQSFDSSSVRAKTDNMDIIFSQNKEISVSMATLQNLLAGFRIKGILPKQIDLRFEKTIIR